MKTEKLQPAPDRTARELGYHMPAEWETLECVWVTSPHNPDTWPGCLDEAQRQFADMVEKMSAHIEVRDTRQLGIPTNDSWIRDYGPIFVTDANGRVACHDFVFNCWGDKYGPYDDDDRVPQHVAAKLNIPLWRHELVLEGGSIEVNGRGTVMTTRQCLLNPNRNPSLSQAQIEQRLHDALGTTHVIWLDDGIAGDDTDGHIDDIARFINADTVAAIRADRSHPDHAALEHNWRTLTKARDQDGSPLNLVELPVPKPVYYDYPPAPPEDPHALVGPQQLPASYANFLIANKAVFVPVFGQANDEVALRAIERAMPGYAVVPVRAQRLVVGLGATHCLTMQQPAGGAGR